MEIFSERLNEYVKEKTNHLKPIIIDGDNDMIMAINQKVRESVPLSPRLDSFINTYNKTIFVREYSTNMAESRRYDVGVKFPCEINFQSDSGRFVGENIFTPRPYISSPFEGTTENDFLEDYLKAKIIDASVELGIIEIPKIILPESYKRIDLSNVFSKVDNLICFESEIDQINSRLK
ncbi:MAG: hypothetical protein PHE32_00015 [Candidatus Shapirobacteria bacterium]|nr:hypothetical protein [Candidatus Shapirobacteria bacterium]MDD4410086.1 hypothetical protein [Candidatus Shapirobacteria bacterium]